MDEEFAYYLMCRQCGDGTVPVGPFASREERGEWMAAHTRETGHDSWLVRDQPNEPSDFD